MGHKRIVYAAAALVVVIVEVAIALFVDDGLVRPYAGDALAVILVYLALRAATRLSIGWSVTAALCLATAIELGQLGHLLDLLGLGSQRLLRVVLGGMFDLRDFAAYAAGALVVLAMEALRKRRAAGTSSPGLS